MLKNMLRILMFACLLFGITFYSFSQIEKKNKEDNAKELTLFSDTLAIVKNEYVDDIETKKLIYGAIKGMLSNLDAYSQFLDPEEYNELKIDTVGEFGGLGIEITIKDGFLMVISQILDTPAWKAGIKSQDRIVKIDKKVTKDMTLQEAVKKLRGKPGTQVIITIWRESKQKLFDVNIRRDIIKIKDVRYCQILEDKIGYIRLVEFREKSDEMLEESLEKLKKEGMDSLILDLRNNPGGILESAINITGFFIEPNKVIVSTNGKKNKKIEYKSKFPNPYLNIPILILINEGSASGSEIVAGALQDYKRAVIAGKKSFGKGSVQSVIPLVDGSAIRVTTNKYYTPMGRTIHNEGIHPDVEIEPDENGEKANKDLDEDLLTKIEKLDNIEQAPEETLDYKKDTQLKGAINLIKGIKIYKNIPDEENKNK